MIYNLIFASHGGTSHDDAIHDDVSRDDVSHDGSNSMTKCSLGRSSPSIDAEGGWKEQSGLMHSFNDSFDLCSLH